ncbi:hypothetical protein K458DRAFT_416155 [Lentithecium fluviatile CBS 122367]|uniref:Extracellular membrane protein CFEM domain-containing protein n=1 Tax=Lentithecium fluviatile CBS 122367 TaxID=1168545 RepID=A0A6G1J8G9_9PLEO|nr:hypothetical protein K458DRAFT_416155 [Lentithecium fluviatile CBS 122367]
MVVILTTLAALIAAASAIAPPTAIPEFKSQCLVGCVAFYHLQNRSELCDGHTGELIGTCLDERCSADVPTARVEYATVCGHYPEPTETPDVPTTPTPTPTTPTSTPTPTPTETIHPFRLNCANKCMGVGGKVYADRDQFCKEAKADDSLFYCVQKLCYLEGGKEAYEHEVDYACGVTQPFRPFMKLCANDCIDHPPGDSYYLGKERFCRYAKEDSELYNCILKGCSLEGGKEEFERMVTKACEPPLKPFRMDCANNAVPNSHYESKEEFCAKAKTDIGIRSLSGKLCGWWEPGEFEKEVDWACLGPFHPFGEACADTCNDPPWPAHLVYTSGQKTDFCKWGKDHDKLYACIEKSCNWKAEDIDKKIDAFCAGPTTPPTPTPTPPYPCWNKTLCSHPPHPTSHHHGTDHPRPTTITTTTTVIETLTYCPPRCTCTGQTTTWTHTIGPTSCPPTTTCTCVLPGAPTKTVFPTIETCPPSVTCTGQTTTETGGYTVILPSETIPVMPANPTEEPSETAAPSETPEVPEFPGAAASAGVGLLAALVGVVVAL